MGAVSYFFKISYCDKMYVCIVFSILFHISENEEKCIFFCTTYCLIEYYCVKSIQIKLKFMILRAVNRNVISTMILNIAISIGCNVLLSH